MAERRQVPLDVVKLAFVATCIEGTARKLGRPYMEIFTRMKHVDLIDKYLMPHYDALHTESYEHLIEDVIECLNNWEEAQG